MLAARLTIPARNLIRVIAALGRQTGKRGKWGERGELPLGARNTLSRRDHLYQYGDQSKVVSFLCLDQIGLETALIIIGTGKRCNRTM